MDDDRKCIHSFSCLAIRPGKSRHFATTCINEEARASCCSESRPGRGNKQARLRMLWCTLPKMRARIHLIRDFEHVQGEREWVLSRNIPSVIRLLSSALKEACYLYSRAPQFLNLKPETLNPKPSR